VLQALGKAVGSGSACDRLPHSPTSQISTLFAAVHPTPPRCPSRRDPSLMESGSLSSARRFAKCRTRQSSNLDNDRVYREQDSRHRNTLGKESFAECQTLGEWRRSVKGRQQPSIADNCYLCRASSFGTRQRSFFVECFTSDTLHNTLCRVPFLDTRQSTFLFFYFPNQTFCGMTWIFESHIILFSYFVNSSVCEMCVFKVVLISSTCLQSYPCTLS
jgi:hypothetical protein